MVIEVEDDGRGIELDKVKRKALARGLISDIEAVSDRDALDFLFLPGFSTSEQVSEISGRGVGMDVVKNNIAAVSGMVDIETKPGAGMPRHHYSAHHACHYQGIDYLPRPDEPMPFPSPRYRKPSWWSGKTFLR